MPPVQRLARPSSPPARSARADGVDPRAPVPVPAPKVGDWNRFTRNTGGTLVEKCCHFFDLMHLVCRRAPVRVLATGGQDVNHLDEAYERRAVPDILDNAFVIVEFANGVRGALDLCMFAEGGRFEQEITITGDLAKMEATVPGDVVWLGERSAAGALGCTPAVASARSRLRWIPHAVSRLPRGGQLRGTPGVRHAIRAVARLRTPSPKACERSQPGPSRTARSMNADRSSSASSASADRYGILVRLLDDRQGGATDGG